MTERTTVGLQQGLWIDEMRLAEAGLKAPLEISVQPGEIRIRSAAASPGCDQDSPAKSQDASGMSEGWELFRSLAREAQTGRLADPSVHHDRYLYGGSE